MAEYIITPTPDAPWVNRRMKTVAETTGDDVYVVDLSGGGTDENPSPVVIQSGDPSGGDTLSSTLSAAVIGGVGSTIGGVIVDAILE